MITIVGATGKTGAGIAEILLKRGEKVRALGRDAAKLKALEEKGAEAAVGVGQGMEVDGHVSSPGRRRPGPALA